LGKIEACRGNVNIRDHFPTNISFPFINMSAYTCQFASDKIAILKSKVENLRHFERIAIARIHTGDGIFGSNVMREDVVYARKRIERVQYRIGELSACIRR
jgi:hypothetical protein